MEWSDVTGWVGQGGAFLGIKRTLPEGKYAEIAARLRQFKIQALLVIGGFEVSRISRPKCPQDAHFFFRNSGLSIRFGPIGAPQRVPGILHPHGRHSVDYQ